MMANQSINTIAIVDIAAQEILPEILKKGLKMLFLRKFTIVMLLLPMAVMAAPNEKLIALATEYVRLLQLNSSLDAYIVECKKSMKSSYDPAQHFSDNPAAFAGISPQSKYWPDVQNLYVRYQEQACNYATQDTVTKYFADQVAERLSEEDIRTVMAFSKTAAARRVQAALGTAQLSFQPYIIQLMNTNTESATKVFREEMGLLALKYKKDPQ